MGRMYAKRLADAGLHVCACDLPEHYERLRDDFASSSIRILRDGHAVSRCSDLVIYSVEAAHVESVVATYGPSTKQGAIVAGQTSVKAPERAAFDAHLPADVRIVSLHSLHGPNVTTEGQPLVIIKHRADDADVALVERIFSCFGSRYVRLTYEEHDLVTANTQAVTHAAFLSMGTAWMNSRAYPWETSRYVGGIEVVKVNLALRIYSNKWHVYAGLAILNPSARRQIDEYAQSATDLFKLMVEERKQDLRDRVYAAREGVFGGPERPPILLSDTILDQFSLGPSPEATGGHPNSHLTVLAMVDCWHRLGIKPYADLDVAGTPVFTLWIGVAEYLFRSTSRLDAAIEAAIHDRTHRSDDTEFIVAARGWSQCVSFGSFELYRQRFEETARFFAPRFDEAAKVGGQMIKTITEDQKRRASA